MAGPETDSAKPKPDAAKTSAAVAEMLPGMLVRLPSVHPRQRRLAVWRPSVRAERNQSEAASAGMGNGHRISWRVFIAFLRFFLPRTLFEPPPFSRLVTPQTTLWEWTPVQQKYRIWVTARPIACSSSTRAARISVARPIGKPARTSSSALARQRLRQRRRQLRRTRAAPMDRAHVELAPDGQIIVDTSRLYQWPRDNPATSVIRDHFCRCNWERRESVPRVREIAAVRAATERGADDARRENAERKEWQIRWPVERLKAGVKEDLESLRQTACKKPRNKSNFLKSPPRRRLHLDFRHKHDDTPRNRALGVLSNVFLHLHPAKINRDAVRYATPGHGGITFYLFIVLTLTGVMLMFYYHPSKVQAFRDVLYLEHDVPFGKLLRNMHRWAAHLMVIAVELHMFRVFLTGSYKKPREFN